jgi:hypothetical protein
MRTVSVVEERPSYAFEVVGGKFGDKLMVTHGAGGRFGGVAQDGVLYVDHVLRRTASDRSKQ